MVSGDYRYKKRVGSVTHMAKRLWCRLAVIAVISEGALRMVELLRFRRSNRQTDPSTL